MWSSPIVTPLASFPFFAAFAGAVFVAAAAYCGAGAIASFSSDTM